MASKLNPVMAPVMVGLPFQNHTAKGRMIAAAIEASDTYLLNARTTPHTASAVKHAAGAQASTTPPEVAMPLPPLNLSQQVKLCPRMAATPAASIRYSR